MYCAKCGYNNPATALSCKNCEIKLPAPALKTAVPDKPAALVYAGFKVRLLAAFLDFLLILAGLILVILVIASLIAFTGRDHLLKNELFTTPLIILAIVLPLLYFILLEAGSHGATLGKRWLNIKVQDLKGQRLSIKRSAARLFAHTLSHLPLQLGFLIQPFTPRKQTLHDLISGCVVIYASESKKISVFASILVIVVALLVPVLAFFATAGIPIYQQYIQDVQIRNALKTAKSASVAVSRFYASNGRVPADLLDTGNSIKTSPHVAGIMINPENGELTVYLSELVRKGIRNKHLLLTPTLAADQSINWKCHSNDIEARYLPDGCK